MRLLGGLVAAEHNGGTANGDQRDDIVLVSN